MKQIFLLSFFIVLVSCTMMEEAEKEAPLVLKPASFADLPGWQEDNFIGFAEAFNRSCVRIEKRDPSRDLGSLKEAGTTRKWQELCRLFQDNILHNAILRRKGAEVQGDVPSVGQVSQTFPSNQHYVKLIREFFEAHFQPYSVMAGDEPEGLFTGYYEASLRGSRVRKPPYTIPLHARPEDLVMVQLGEFREELKGVRIAGRVINGNLKPYEDRAQIISGDWPHSIKNGGDKVLVWVDDPVDAFFVQIQGSGVVQLDDGSVMRIGYAGQNGHVYYAIGRELIKRGHLQKGEVSMQAIRAWLAANPAEADEIMNTNRSYVFFRELTGEGPIGGQGVALTAGRSLAVDHSLWSYGLPFWLDAEMGDVCEAYQESQGTRQTGGRSASNILHNQIQRGEERSSFQVSGVGTGAGATTASSAATDSTTAATPPSTTATPSARDSDHLPLPTNLQYVKLNGSARGSISRGAHGVCADGRLQRLMVAQDTGGAIRGPVRGDVFWGFGLEAEQLAGPMAAKGRYWVLLPK